MPSEACAAEGAKRTVLRVSGLGRTARSGEKKRQNGSDPPDAKVACLDGRSLPVAGVVIVNEMRGGKGDNPEAHHEAADGENPSPGGAILDRQRGGLARAKNLTANANAHQQSTENKGEPRHGLPFYPILHGCGKSQPRSSGSKVSDTGFPGNSALPGEHLRRVTLMKIVPGAVLLTALILSAAGGQRAAAQGTSSGASDASAGIEDSLDQGRWTLGISPELVSPQLASLRKEVLPGVVHRTNMELMKIAPAEVRPPLHRQGTVTIAFMLHSDGKVTNMLLLHGSGDVVLDRTAWAAITGSAPYAAFPTDVNAPQAQVQLTFLYNERPQPTK